MNTRNRTQSGLTAILLALAAIPACGATTYTAFSLRTAERLLQEGTQKAKVRTLGGIRKVVAVVYDESRGDVVLVGEEGTGEQVGGMDELVMGLRAVLKYGQSPEVTIERTPETERTKRQEVRFEGGIANSRFADYLLDADIDLKEAALGKLRTQAYGLHSYFDMCVKDWRQTGREQAVQCRFVFVPDKERSYAESRAGVGIIRALKIKVRTEVARLPGRTGEDSASGEVQDEVGSRFASDMTAALDNMCRRYKAIDRLDALFRLTGVAEVLKKWKTKDGMDLPCLEYWLDRYLVKTTRTPDTYRLAAREARQGPKKSRRRMVISGGVELRALVHDIKDGSVTALRDFVVKCRPSENALTWPVPLGFALDEMEASSSTPEDVEQMASSSRYGTLGTALRREFSGVRTGATPPGTWNTTAGISSPGTGIGTTNSNLGVTGRYTSPSPSIPALPSTPKYTVPSVPKCTVPSIPSYGTPKVYTPVPSYRPPTVYTPSIPRYQPMNIPTPRPSYTPPSSFRR
jgi:hypothetical protein